MLTAYLHHESGAQGPFLTESVEVKSTEAPRNNSRTGYGSRLPTRYMVKYLNKWRRVYCVIYSNVGTLYIGPAKNKTIVQIDDY